MFELWFFILKTIKEDKMKKLITTLAVMLALSTGSISLFAQGLDLGLGGGVTQILGPEGLTNSVEENGAGYSTEFNFGLKGKFTLPLLPLKPNVFFLYHIINGSGDVTGGTVENSQNIMTIGAGVEYSFLPVPGPVSPYLGLDVFYTGFGEFESKTPAATIKGESSTRYGLGIGAGAEITAAPKVDIDVNVKYNMLNLLGKDDGEETISAINLNVFIFFSVL